ncbi:MFS transporter [Propionibacterium australiense]|nr:MFS transporter [Propionibacterium australiense]
MTDGEAGSKGRTAPNSRPARAAESPSSTVGDVRAGVAAPGRQQQIQVVLWIVFLVYLGQMSLNPVIAPLAREVGLAEWQIGVTISVAAVMVVLCSQFWGRRSQSWGSGRVLGIAMTLAALAMVAFTLVSWAGMRGTLPGGVLFALFVVLRGVCYGTAISAVLPTAQAHIAAVTAQGPERVRGMAGVGAAQSTAMVLGSAVGGLLAGIGLLLPIALVPVELMIGLLLVAWRLRRRSHAQLIAAPARISARDARVWPFLVAGFGMFTAFGFVQVIAGFLVQDRLGLDASRTGVVTGVVLLSAGLGMIVSQSVIVPRSRWFPVRLLRVGTLTAAVGFALMAPAGALWLLVVAVSLIGIGLGLATPGYTSGPSMLVGREEQGGLAGLLGAVSGLSYVLSPTASTVLYGISWLLPVLVGAAMMAAVWVFLLAHPRFRE